MKPWLARIVFVCALLIVLDGLAAERAFAGEAATEGGESKEAAPAEKPPVPAEAPPAAPAPTEASPEEVKMPLLRKLVDKGVLSPAEAAEIEKGEKAKEEEQAKKEWSFIDSLAERIKLGGLTYFGYTYTVPKESSASGDFELRRNYITLGATLTKDLLFRNTIDVTREAGGGSIEVRVKYAYLYFDRLLPATSLEVGVVHRPWIDWEEHHGWWYRSVEKTFIEFSDGADLVNSTDLGADLKIAVPYFSSEIGLFNGEGYDHLDRTGGAFFDNSIEGRATFHALGTGDRSVKPTKDRYLDFSFATINNFRLNYGASSATVPGSSRGPGGALDRLVYQAHAVFNMPLLLVAAQFIYNQDRYARNLGNLDNRGFSVNGEFRPLILAAGAFPDAKDRLSLFGRFDYWDVDNGERRKAGIYGIAYQLNRYLQFIVSGITADHDDEARSYSKAMFTVVVEW